MFDTAILGTGPAGISAALTLKLHEKKVIWFGSKELSPKVQKSEKIANFPGMPFISGAALNDAFARQIREMNLEITDAMVTNVMKMKDHFVLLAGNDMVEAKTILLSTGVLNQKSFEGESKLLGRGVSYCATCDGFLYKGKTIAVFCGSKRYEHEVEYLAGIAKEVYLYAPYKDCQIHLDHVQKITPIKAVIGEDALEGIELYSGEILSVSGLFCLRDAVAPERLVSGLRTEGAHIPVTAGQKTNLPGCFAAGDCTGRPYQIAKAIGEGNIAAHSILEYLEGDQKA